MACAKARCEWALAHPRGRGRHVISAPKMRKEERLPPGAAGSDFQPESFIDM